MTLNEISTSGSLLQGSRDHNGRGARKTSELEGVGNCSETVFSRYGRAVDKQWLGVDEQNPYKIKPNPSIDEEELVKPHP